jgi:hypothetical protein
MSKIKIGDRVRVKKGVKDPDFPKHDLGGVTGIVKSIYGDYFEFIMDDECVEAMPKYIKKAIERLDVEANNIQLKIEDVVNV